MTFFYPTNAMAGRQRGLVLLIMLVSALEGVGQERPAFRGEHHVTTNDGHVRLQWPAVAPDAIYEVQQSTTTGFKNPRIIYTGPDRATFVSGLNNGIYYYRFRADKGDWSDTLTVSVKHYSLRLAFTLCGIGALVFLLTAGVILKGTTNRPHE